MWNTWFDPLSVKGVEHGAQFSSNTHRESKGSKFSLYTNICMPAHGHWGRYDSIKGNECRRCVSMYESIGELMRTIKKESHSLSSQPIEGHMTDLSFGLTQLKCLKRGSGSSLQVFRASSNTHWVLQDFKKKVFSLSVFFFCCLYPSVCTLDNADYLLLRCSVYAKKGVRDAVCIPLLIYHIMQHSWKPFFLLRSLQCLRGYAV